MKKMNPKPKSQGGKIRKQDFKKIGRLGEITGIMTLRNGLLKEVLRRHTPFKEGSLGFRDIEKIGNRFLAKLEK